MTTFTTKLPIDKLPKLPAVKLPTVSVDLDEAKKPAFAAVGVVDFYLEAAKEIPAEAKKIQDKMQLRLESARTELEGRVVKAQASATAYYGELAVRGEKLVAQVRRQPGTESAANNAIAEGKAAVKKAQSAASSSKKATTTKS